MLVDLLVAMVESVLILAVAYACFFEEFCLKTPGRC